MRHSNESSKTSRVLFGSRLNRPEKKNHNINWCHGFNSNFTNKTTIYVNNDEHRHEIHKFSLAIKIKLGESILQKMAD